MIRIILLTFALTIALGARSQEQAGTLENCAIVTGQCEKEYAPDEFYLRIYIRESDSKGKLSISEQQRAMTKALEEAGIDVKKALSTIEIASSHYKRDQNLAYGRYELKLATPKEVFEAYAALHAQGISEISLSGIGRSDQQELEFAASAEALKNARLKAETIAAAEGLKVGRCLFFSDSTDFYAQYGYGPLYSTDMISEITRQDTLASQTDITSFPEIGTVKISVVVQAKFELK